MVGTTPQGIRPEKPSVTRAFDSCSSVCEHANVRLLWQAGEALGFAKWRRFEGAVKSDMKSVK